MAADDVAANLRRADPDRFFTSLFAPPHLRSTLMLLYAFNHELARAREVASAPGLALIRLHWWREVVEGAARHHVLAEPLAEALARGSLHAPDLLAMVDGREAEAGEIATSADWTAYLRGTAGAVAVAAARLLGATGSDLDRVAELGMAYGVAGQIRSIARLAAQGRCLLPHDLLTQHGLTPESVVADPATPALHTPTARLAAQAQGWLRRAGGTMPRGYLAAALPAVLARRDLRRGHAPPRGRGVADKGAVLAAYAMARV